MFKNSCTLRKTAKVVLFMALSLFMVSCEADHSCKVIDENASDLTESMRHFFDSEVNSYAESPNFMAKIISLDKLAYDYEEPVIGDSYIYKMIVAIAPHCDQKISIDYFNFSLSDEAEKYYNEFPWLSSYAMFNIPFFESFELPEVNGAHDAQAYRFDLTFDNAGNENQNSYGLDDAAFDEMIKELNIRIGYNGKEDNIKITFCDDMHFYQRLDDIPADREDLRELFINGNNGSQQVGGYFTKKNE